MRVVLIAAVTADGFIGRSTEQASTDWTSGADKQFFTKTTKEIGVMIMGSNTYKTIGRALPERQIIVLTSHPDSFDPTDRVQFTKEAPGDVIERLSGEGSMGVAVCGGASVYHQFMKAGLVHEVYLTVEPLFFGKGVPLFADALETHLELTDSQLLSSGSVLNHYKVL